MTITSFDPADSAAMGQWYDVMVAVTSHDVPDFPTPSRRAHLVRFEHSMASVTEEALLAWDGDRVVGVASYQLPQTENLSMLYLELLVHPQYRRRGIGTRLMEEVYAAARRHDRSLIEVDTVRGFPGGATRDEAGYRYLTNRGHQPGATGIRSRYEVSGQTDEAMIAEAWTHADGYSLVQWRDAVPEEIIDDVAALQSRLMLDAPTGDLAVEQQVYDADRVRDQEKSELDRGYHWYSTAARHDATGQIVARTKLAFEAEGNTHARQRTTIVEPTHRGHRLGLLVKSANHTYTQSHEPTLMAIDAWNDEQNTPMRAVNTQLGFHPVDTWLTFQLPAT
ncbi:GNAT family N-acetyltransferase [Kribbella shirazensis]|uniref:GNAT superfamily N-acetyltransferase/RimJ/RimL family protein N-acetyltransferase n=1 Tax=Kribbella shirazensis TaxID=1105143 RepID=A0A7X5VEY7_9ACTN|nr:GNAT family N-acetyltransferase [Kribbella shirazensis]NIK59923.1 GNAT superfamily N-acetyltransferase/RimJ/RimL family protein N-acetyltransferase [Kribbella shirazensis]